MEVTEGSHQEFVRLGFESYLGMITFGLIFHHTKGANHESND